MEPFDFQKVELFCQVTVEPFNLRLERTRFFLPRTMPAKKAAAPAGAAKVLSAPCRCRRKWCDSVAPGPCVDWQCCWRGLADTRGPSGSLLVRSAPAGKALAGGAGGGALQDRVVGAGLHVCRLACGVFVSTQYVAEDGIGAVWSGEMAPPQSETRPGGGVASQRMYAQYC